MVVLRKVTESQEIVWFGPVGHSRALRYHPSSLPEAATGCFLAAISFNRMSLSGRDSPFVELHRAGPL